MSRFKLPALALASASLAATGAHAAILQGGGSTLLAPYWAQAVGCWAPGVTGSPANNGQYVDKGPPAQIVTPMPVTGTGCSISTDSIEYVAAGAGAGQAALFAHEGLVSLFGPNLDGSGGQVFTAGGIQYGLSDNALVDSDIGVYSVGTNAAYTTPGGSVIVTPVSYQGLTYGAGGTAGGFDADIAKPKYGALVQFPIAIVPVAITYNPSYDGVHNLQLGAGITTLRLDRAAYCGIFSHTITDWNDPVLTALNGGASLTGGASASIHLVGDAYSSGTTSILTRHLAAVCGLPAVWGVAGRTNLPFFLQPFYSLANGDLGIAAQLHAQPGSIGYISPSYAAPAVANTGVNTFNLPIAQLKNNAGLFRAPIAAAITAAFNSAPVPAVADRSNPLNWVQSTASTVPLANPTASGAYPIVGTTNFLGYTCYAIQAEVDELNAFLTFHDGAKAATILGTANLLPLPTAWTTAIGETFVNPTGSAGALNLFFARAGAGSPNPNCAQPGVVGG